MKSVPTGRYCVASIVLLVVGLAVSAAPCRAELFSANLDTAGWTYGGFVGFYYHESPFDFGQQFASISAAWLHVQGSASIPPPTDLRFWTNLDGASLQSQFTELSTTFQHDLPMSLSNVVSVLDGQGTAGLALNIISPPEPAAGVGQAILWFDAVPVPEPAAFSMLALGGLLVMPHRHQAA
jgi:hypothetical protein